MDRPFTVTVTFDLEAATPQHAREVIQLALGTCEFDEKIDGAGGNFLQYSVGDATEAADPVLLGP